MYYAIIEYIERDIKPYNEQGKNLKEITEKVIARGRENGDKVLHICKYDYGFGACGNKPYSNKVHRIKID